MTATLLQLKTQVRDLADEPASGGFAVDARLTDYINLALGELHDILITSYEDYFVKQQTIALVNGTESYSISSDYYKTLAVFAVAGDHRYKLRRFMIEELDRLQDDVIIIRASHQHLRYRVFDDEIWFTPKPTGGTIEHWYIYQFAPLSTDESTIDANVPVTWEDFVICSATHRLLVRGENENAPDILQLKMAARQRIIDAAPERDAGDPHRVVDVSHRFSEYGRIG